VVTSQLAGHRYVPEIEGLRAVAAVLVAVYHVFLGRVSGGVDVFFVIAGFLITTSLVAQATGDDGVRAGRYLGRLVVRLLPVALLVLAFVIVGVFLWMPATRHGSMLAEVAASALYVENWALAAKAVDYAAREAVKSPVQHFWAMAVQGQFYVIWLLLAGVIGLAAGRRRFRRLFGAALILLFAASLAWSALLTASNQPLAYFHTGVRVWEFAAGGLLALAIGPIRARLDRAGQAGTLFCGIAGWAGLALVVSCGLVLSVSSQFPGVAALWPVAGALLVVIAAGRCGRFGVGRLLASRPFVFVGGVAYALYLWHWPVLTFVRSARPSGEIDLPAGVFVLVVSFILAVVSTRLVEQPVRLRLAATPHPWRAVAGGAAALLLVASVSVTLDRLRADGPANAATAGVPVFDDEALAVEPEDLEGVPGIGAGAAFSGGAQGTIPPGAGAPSPGAGASTNGGPGSSGSPGTPAGSAAPATPAPGIMQARSKGPFVPAPLVAARDVAALNREGCQQKIDQPDLVICERGAVGGHKTAMLIGGSHAAHWYPALNAIAKRRDWRLVTGVKAGCRITLSREFSEDGEAQSCKAWLDELLRYMDRNPPDFVITTGTATNPRKEWVPEGYLDIWRMLDTKGIPVIAIRDTPRAPFDRVDCLALHETEPWQCDIAREPTLDRENPMLLDDLPSNVIPVDVNAWLCSTDVCPAVLGHVTVYRDAHHLTATYARTLAPMLAAQIPKDPQSVFAATGQ
jgi:peptidoglycan/LPS O-acetylase OafA/YrhL